MRRVEDRKGRMARNFKDLWNEILEPRAREHYFLNTGRDFSKLPPTSQRKLIEAEMEYSEKRFAERKAVYDRVPEGDFSLIPGPGRNNGGFDIPE